MKTGAKDSQAKAKDYEFVFEDQIDFITDQAMAGTLVCRVLPSSVLCGCPCGLLFQMALCRPIAQAMLVL